MTKREHAAPVWPADEIAWAQAGFTDDDGSGDLGRPAHVGGWLVPAKAWHKSGFLYWDAEGTVTDDSFEYKVTQGGPALFDDFLALATTPTDHDAVVRFAGEWGVPELCVHGMPMAHVAPSAKVRDDFGLLRSTTRRGVCRRQRVAGQLVIRIADVIRWSEYVRALLFAAATVQLGRPVDDERVALLDVTGHWSLFCKQQPTEAARLRLDTAMLANGVDGFLGLSAIQVRFNMPILGSSDSFQLEIQPHGPLGSVALQLALIFSQADGFAICAGCARPFVPKRQPRPGERSWCPKCGLAAAQRAAARRYKQRQRAKGAAVYRAGKR
ncbi:MAG: hypothetical protein JO214_14575 [Frankiaceae bacterium]|nr:hypothetical protein [Frankiaceae bacterium]